MTSALQEFTKPAPLPKTLLGYHRILAPTAGIKVSPLCLGGANFGDAWSAIAGECNKEQSFALLDTFYEAGGNFIDTACNYQDGESETRIGEWMDQRKNRDQMVIATKYTGGHRRAYRDTEPLQSNYIGNSAKSLHQSVNSSLKRLKTDYIDLLYVHWWDFTTSVEEVMRALNHLVAAGKVLYLGISDTPAWVVVAANDFARSHGLAPFSVYQGLWNANIRDMEREVLQMCQHQGMAIAPWGTVGQGNFRTAEAQKHEKTDGRQMGVMTEADVKVSAALEKIADAKGSTLQGVALSYVMHKVPNVFPIVGGRKTEHLKSNIEALSLQLSEEDIDAIEAAVPFDPGFPLNFLYGGVKFDVNKHFEGSMFQKMAAHYDQPPKPLPIRPRSNV